MGHKDKNNELRKDRIAQEQDREELREDAFEGEGGAVQDAGSQDERREEGNERH